MSTTAPVFPANATSAQAPTAASVLALLQGIERVGPDAPAAIAFRKALARKGLEADAAGGAQALDALRREIRAADPDRADARERIIGAAWTGLSGCEAVA